MIIFAPFFYELLLKMLIKIVLDFKKNHSDICLKTNLMMGVTLVKTLEHSHDSMRAKEPIEARTQVSYSKDTSLSSLLFTLLGC